LGLFEPSLIAPSKALYTSFETRFFKVAVSPLLKAVIIISKAFFAPSKNALCSNDGIFLYTFSSFCSFSLN
jgi:hypothetical protein